MRDLYATTMQLVHLGGGDAFDVACERALEWAWRVDGEIPDLTETPTGQASDDGGDRGTTVSWAFVASQSTRSLEVRLQHPDDGDSTLRWHAMTTITDVEGATRATLRLGLSATVHSLRPWRISLRAPSVVAQFMQSPLLAYAGSLELDSGPRIVEVDDVKPLMNDQLKAEGRALPILVASSDVDVPLVEALARGVAGLAQVARARNGATDDALRTALSPSGFTVPRGGLRLFWPGFGLEGQPRRHPYWTAAQLRSGGHEADRSVIDQLVNLLAPISTGRVPVDAGALKARQERLQERLKTQRAREEATRERARRQREDAQRTKREAQRLATDGNAKHLEDLSEVEARLALVEGERKTAEDRFRGAEEAEMKAVEEAIGYSDRVEALEAENSDLRKNIQYMSRFGLLREEEDDDSNPIPEALDTWEDIAEHLSDLEGPGFCLSDQARECANGKGRYPRPDLIWRNLRAMERAGRAYNEMGAELGMRFDQFAMEQAGITVALQDSTYADCWFEYEGAWYQRLPHVKIDDAKAPNQVGRIYFALDADGKRVIVDWFGTKPDRPQTKQVA